MVWAVLLCLAASCTASGGSEAADGTSPPGEKGANSADRVLFWIGQKEFVALSDKDLRRWHETYGVDGFVASTQWLNEMGGNQQLSTDPNADLGGDAFTLQRTLRDSKIVARAHDMGMKLYLGFYLANVLNGRTPLREWFDENGWQNVVLPRVAEFARGAKALGFDGLALDSEMYPQADGTANATWAVGYPGNTHPAAETRAMATRRGKQLMEAIVGAFPDVELQVYGSSFPDSWAELVQQ